MLLEQILARPRETLTAHTQAVVAQVERLEKLHPQPDDADLYAFLRLAAWFHDSGKLARGFQQQLTRRSVRWGLRHEVLSLAFLDWLDLDEHSDLWITALIATHHRDASLIFDHYLGQGGRCHTLILDVPEETSVAWYKWLAQFLPLNPYTRITTQGIEKRLRAFDAWQYELMQQGMAHPDFSRAILARGLMFQADHGAAAGVPDLGKPAWDPRRLHKRRLYAHQKQCKRSSEQDILLTAPTGSGKTEAALLWANQTDASRVWYVLPYRASLNAMHARLCQLTPHVGLQHGRALSALYHLALEESPDQAAAQRQAQTRRSLARLHAYPVQVTSPFQLLKTVYRAKGSEAVLADVAHGRIIVDEIHAYDPERLALILGMFGVLRRSFQARFCIMTATLPVLIEQAIARTVGDLTRISASSVLMRHFQRHRIHFQRGDLLHDQERMLQAAASGKTVLIVVNTVRRARTLARTLRERGGDVHLLHGRFTVRDRWQHEQNLLRIGMQPPPGTILVATQVVEVSLNLDFDVLFSDPAPLDALLQRFGRVNRLHRRKDPAPVMIYSEPTGAEQRFSPYDVPLVQATVDWLQAHDQALIDEATIHLALDAIYAHSPTWQTRFDDTLAQFERGVLQTWEPFEASDRAILWELQRRFNECAVLPVSLEEEYRALQSRQPILADDLLVSMSWQQFAMLERLNLAWRGEGENEGLCFVDLPYNAQSGLQTTPEDEEE